MKKYRCPVCHTTTQVIRQTKRGKSIRYKCKGCVKYFSINTIHSDTKAMLQWENRGANDQKNRR